MARWARPADSSPPEEGQQEVWVCPRTVPGKAWTLVRGPSIDFDTEFVESIGRVEHSSRKGVEAASRASRSRSSVAVILGALSVASRSKSFSRTVHQSRVGGDQLRGEEN